MRFLRDKLCLLLIFFSAGVLVLGLQPLAEAADEPVVSADAAILIEASTGRVVYEKNADKKEYPASLTKMLTCIMALENGNMDARITVSPHTAHTDYTRLLTGEQFTLGELLQEMMLVSDNGAAVAVSEYMASSTSAFADQMNKKAVEIGARNSHFVTPNGLHDPRHYSTARDLAKIAAYSWHNAKFRELAGTKEKQIHWLYPAGKAVLMENTNELLGTYPGANGLKTGYTDPAGGCLAASAERKGVQLIAIVLHSSDEKQRFQDASTLLDYGFQHVQMAKGENRERMEKTVFVYGGAAGQVSVRPAQDVNYPLIDGEKAEHYSIRYDLPRFQAAPVKAGQKMGELILCYDGQELSRIDILADHDVDTGFSLLSFLNGVVHSLLV